MYRGIKALFNPVPLNTKQYQVILTKYHQVPTSTAPVPPNTSHYRPILTQYHHISISLATKPRATMSLTTIVPCNKFYNRLKQKKTKDHNSNKRFALFTWSSNYILQPIICNIPILKYLVPCGNHFLQCWHFSEKKMHFTRDEFWVARPAFLWIQN